jgi:transcriptional regulator with XRE-family HTH domain
MKTNSKDEFLFSIGSTLRQLRMRKGYKSAEVFSYENDLNRTAYWRWENGENITMKNFLKLCKIHNVTPRDLFEIIENKKYNNGKAVALVNEPGSVLYKEKRKSKNFETEQKGLEL